MLRKLLIISFLFGAVVVSYAQKKDKKRGKKNKSKTEQTVSAEAKDVDHKELGSPLPTLRIVTHDTTEYTNKDFESKSNLLVMLFNPTCDHCIDETHLIEKNIDMFDKTKILLVAAPSMMSYLQYFQNVTRYRKYPKIVLGVDSAGYIDKTFNYTTLPQINIYDKNRKLIKVFNGEVPIEDLKPYID